MSDQTSSSESAEKIVVISHDDELRLNAAVYQAHFTAADYVRLGTHPDWDLIFVRPINQSAESLPERVTDVSYKFDDTGYTGEISCRLFLRHHNYNHTSKMKYVAEWWPEQRLLCVDLTDPV
jgi:hypothetical protein